MNMAELAHHSRFSGVDQEAVLNNINESQHKQL
jgi:hypothetical protein